MNRIMMGMVVLSVALAAAGARAEGAAAIFEKKCATCHGKDGKGQTKMGEKMGIKDLTAFPGTAADLEKVVSDGRGKMPAFKGKLSEAEIKDVAAFIKGGLK